MSNESNTGVLFYIIAALVGMGVGFVTIWSQIRGQNRQAKLDMESTKVDLEKRVRDYLNLKLDNIEMQINHLKENIARLDRKVNKGYQQDTIRPNQQLSTIIKKKMREIIIKFQFRPCHEGYHISCSERRDYMSTDGIHLERCNCSCHQ